MTAGKKPLLSVVTVCFQDIENVKITCKSVKAQLGDLPIEHILVDGGSSDGTQAWYEANTPAAVSTMMSERDEGIFDAMNKGIAAASGTYINFLNAGDAYSDPAVLRRVCDRLTSESPTWAYGRARIVNSMGTEVRAPVGMVPYSRRRHLWGLAGICHQAVYARTQFIKELGGFKSEYETAGDYHLLVLAGSHTVPTTWRDVDVNFGVGGISDVRVYRHLFNRHRARKNALQMRPLISALDSMWTVGQAMLVAMRKRAKPALRKIGVKKFFGRVTAA